LSQPGWYPDPAGSGSLRWWNGTHWTENLNPEPAGGARRREAAARQPGYQAAPTHEPLHDAGWDGRLETARLIDATVGGLLLHADEQVVAYGGSSMAWVHVEWVAYWAASVPSGYGRRPGVQWIFQAGRHPFLGGPKVEVVIEDTTVTLHGPPGAETGAGAESRAAEDVWRGLVGLCQVLAEQRLVSELAGRVKSGESIDVAHGLTLHPGGVRAERVSLGWQTISGAVLENGRVWIQQTGSTTPVLYVPQQNPNAVLIPALLAALKK
jgi:hypothetical protein